MKLPPSADCRRRFTFVNRHQFPIFKKQCGGADRDRTCYLFRAREALSQMSYSPNCFNLDSRSSGPAWTRTTDLILIRDAL